jgi:hypothetical protein
MPESALLDELRAYVANPEKKGNCSGVRNDIHGRITHIQMTKKPVAYNINNFNCGSAWVNVPISIDYILTTKLSDADALLHATDYFQYDKVSAEYQINKVSSIK